MKKTLEKLVALANRLDMEFIVNKCGVELQYQMKDGWVRSVDEERDVGVIISKGLKFLKQCLLAKNR